jgi:hypothetical protein
VAFNNVGFFTQTPGAVGRYWVSFGGADHGAQSIHAHPLNPGGSLQVDDETKVMNNNGSFTYWVTIKNIGSLTTNFSLQGGGYTGGFNNVGLFTQAPGAVGRYWVSFGGADHGAQSLHAHPLNPGGSLEVDDQTKVMNNNGSFTYWVTIRNIGSITTNFSLQGGGYI